jgi:hypothetical protein
MSEYVFTKRLFYCDNFVRGSLDFDDFEYDCCTTVSVSIIFSGTFFITTILILTVLNVTSHNMQLDSFYYYDLNELKQIILIGLS